MTVNEPTDEAVDNIITTLSEKLFANTVIEEYSYKVIDERSKHNMKFAVLVFLVQTAIETCIMQLLNQVLMQHMSIIVKRL